MDDLVVPTESGIFVLDRVQAMRAGGHDPFGIDLVEDLHICRGQPEEDVFASCAAGLPATPFDVSGKSLNKDEFVTCGGVRLSEVDFKTMQSKVCPGLFFAGELLDIDGITGGFNFQAAWTTGWIAGRSIAAV